MYIYIYIIPKEIRIVYARKAKKINAIWTKQQ